MTGAGPVPVADSVSAEFWAGCRRHQLLIARCIACEHLEFPPVERCTACWSDRVGSLRSEGRGIVEAVAFIRSSVVPQFMEQCPYTVVLVRLVEGVRMVGRLHGADAGEDPIGLAVRVDFVDTVDCSVPVWQPAG